jgi:alginate O-acetyltransferase complex protein AlgI
MVVNSINFFIFFTIVFVIYYLFFNEHTKLQNWLLLVASYFFYGFASLKAVPILLIATVVFFFIGKFIAKYNIVNKRTSSILTTIGVCLGVGLLLYFKYLNFFIESFTQLFNSIGLKCNPHTFNIILPIGISFFTFKVMSYLIEVHRRKMEVCTDFVAFATYVAFFPTILSGPIDRPNKFIPQIQSKRSFNYNLVVDGLKQILWGMFMKVCIADRLALYNDAVFNNLPMHNGTTILLVVLLYPLQLYADFGGYSEMAIGVGKILGFNVMRNFTQPFFCRNIAEFWRNWHISLTSWLTDYVFIPLNIKFRNLGDWGTIIAILINFILIGFWHGANWTYGLFGLYNGLLYVPLILTGGFAIQKKLKLNSFNLIPLSSFVKIIVTYIIITVGMVFFRLDSVHSAMSAISKIFISHGRVFFPLADASAGIISLLFLLAKDWVDRFNLNFNFLHSKYVVIRYLSVITLIAYILLLGVLDGSQFIYFQF